MLSSKPDNDVGIEGGINDHRFTRHLIGEKVPEVPVTPRTKLFDNHGSPFHHAVL